MNDKKVEPNGLFAFAEVEKGGGRARVFFLDILSSAHARRERQEAETPLTRAANLERARLRG